MTGTAAMAEALPQGALIAGRYEVRALLGRGGMSFVYRVRDLVAGPEVALKLLMLKPGSSKSVIAVLFEREFHTLSQLRHPHVIAVHDYGLIDSSPYYTMELLDGGDLRERAPVHWRDACRLFFEVCSSIALLHSRRLLHRDISPRNIRCTLDGRAKLIDFGAMAPMNSGAAEVVGTPPFVAPETVHRLALDSRTDLFSLGATLYYALTGRMAYPARTFAEAMMAWRGKIAAPSTITPGIPTSLDDLVLALINPEPLRRPQNAFEVMQRLAAIAGLPPEESAAVSAAYLATPTLIGRDAHLSELREQLAAVRTRRAGALLIHGHAGVGRSRMLDAFALEAKTLGFTVLRAAGSVRAERFAVPRALTRHLLETLPGAALEKLVPGLLEPDLALDPEQLQERFCELWLSVSRQWPLLIAVDDVHRIDPSSAAVLAAFLDRSREAQVVVALSSDSDELTSDTVRALARRCRVQQLQPLTAAEAHLLLGSLFGEVANLDLLARELHPIARGNPRQTIDLAQYLVDRGAIRYVAGTWTLPSQLEAADLPHSFGEALRERARLLSSDARFLAEAQALAFYETLQDSQYRALLPEATLARVESAKGELLAIQALASHGVTYALANRLWAPALCGALGPTELSERHRALATMYRPISRVAFIYHAFAGGLEKEALQKLQQLNHQYATEIDHVEVVEQNVAKMMSCYPQAFEVARQLRCSPRALQDLRRWRLVGSVTIEDGDYPQSAQEYLDQLQHDCGLDLYRADPDPDPPQRLMRALTSAQQRYLMTPEAERVYSLEEALRLLAEYVAICIMIGGRTHDAQLLSSLPPLLEPFVALSPMLDAIWNNAVAACAMVKSGNLEVARERWLAVLANVDNTSESDMKHAREIGNAVAYALGLVEAQLGMPTATGWADRLEKDPYQRISALQLRRIVRLEQGDTKGAERLRRQAEVLALQARGAQMFKTLLMVELSACFNAGDLVGIQDVIERIRPIAGRFCGWRPHLRYAEGCFHLVRGDCNAARLEFEQCMVQSEGALPAGEPSSMLWYMGVVGLTEALMALNQPAEARTFLRRALELQTRQGRRSLAAVEIVRALALAEAMLGDPQAPLLLDASIAEQQRIGATGIRLGMSYEARAQIAIWQGDAGAFQRYAELTAREYRYGAGSALGARYDRLLNEARRRGLQPSAALSQLVGATTTHSGSMIGGDVQTKVHRTLSEESTAAARARAALALICDAHTAQRGHLYLNSGDDLVHVASLGDERLLPDAGVLRDLVTRVRAHATEMDDIATDELVSEPENYTIACGARRYEPLLLSCTSAETHVAGVALVEVGAASIDRSRSGRLLRALAEHLIVSGDVAQAFTTTKDVGGGRS